MKETEVGRPKSEAGKPELQKIYLLHLKQLTKNME